MASVDISLRWFKVLRFRSSRTSQEDVVFKQPNIILAAESCALSSRCLSLSEQLS